LECPPSRTRLSSVPLAPLPAGAFLATISFEDGGLGRLYRFDVRRCAQLRGRAADLLKWGSFRLALHHHGRHPFGIDVEGEKGPWLDAGVAPLVHQAGWLVDP